MVAQVLTSGSQRGIYDEVKVNLLLRMKYSLQDLYWYACLVRQFAAGFVRWAGGKWLRGREFNSFSWFTIA
jgi:hypothetical protein